jgi:hypothetical protein
MGCSTIIRPHPTLVTTSWGIVIVGDDGAESGQRGITKDDVHTLHTLITKLLSPIRALHYTKVIVTQAYVLLALTAMASSTSCPLCGVPSSQSIVAMSAT